MLKLIKISKFFYSFKFLYIILIFQLFFCTINQTFSKNWKPNHFGSFLSSQIARSNLDIENSAYFSKLVYENEKSSPALAFMAIESLVSNGQIKEALTIVNGIEDLSNMTLPLYLKAIYYLEYGDYDSVKKVLAKVSPNGIDNYIFPILEAWVEAGLRNHIKAIDALNIQANTGILSPIYDYHAALISDWAGEHELAIQKYTEALTRGNEPSARLFISAILFFNKIQLIEKSKEIDAKFKNTMPDSSELLIFNSQIDHLYINRPTANNIKEGIAEVFLNASEILYNEGIVTQALVYSQLSLYLNKRLDHSKLILGNIFKSNKNYERALNYYKNINSDSFLSIKSKIAIAKSLSEMKMVDQAISTLENNQNKYKDNYNYLKTIAEIYYNKKDFDNSSKYYEKIFSTFPSIEERNWTLLYSNGIALERAGKWKLAEEKFKRALEYSPDHPLVLNYLGYTWLDQGVNINIALEMIKKAIEQRPNDGYIVDSLGWGFYQIGDYEKAVENLEKAAELIPGDPVITDHLGDALFQIGRKIEANFQWKKALEFKPETELFNSITNKIKGIKVPELGVSDPSSKDM